MYVTYMAPFMGQSPSKNCNLRAANFSSRSWLAGNLPITTSSQNCNIINDVELGYALISVANWLR